MNRTRRSRFLQARRAKVEPKARRLQFGQQKLSERRCRDFKMPGVHHCGFDRSLRTDLKAVANVRGVSIAFVIGFDSARSQM
jgi:hypothetical protein